LKEVQVRAHPGDHLIIKSHHTGQADSEAEVLEAMGEGSGPPFQVRWLSDGHESVIFPGSDAVIEPKHHPARKTHG
jgi:hypothetical protein